LSTFIKEFYDDDDDKLQLVVVDKCDAIELENNATSVDC